MTRKTRRTGGRPWLATFAASCALVTVAGWQLQHDAAGTTSGLTLQAAPASSTKARSTNARTAPRPPAATRSITSRHGSARPRAGEPGRPRTLVISRLGLRMPIRAVTVDETGAMALPDRPSIIGWYAYGPRPGAAEGSAVLAGHVDSRTYGIGPLVKLQQLKVGDRIDVRTDAGRQRFTVTGVELVRKSGLSMSTLFDRQSAPQLRIVTCGGDYRRFAGGYQANVVVTATPH